jgi:predicted permease
MPELIQVLRRLRRRPGTPLFAAITLALGVAIALAVASVVRGVLLRELPYPDPDRLVLVWRGTAEEPSLRGALSPGDWLDLRERSDAFVDVAAVNSFGTTLVDDDGAPEQVRLGVVTGSFFDVMGLRPMLGRGIRPGDDGPRQGENDVGLLVLDHAYWQRRFGGDSTVVGRSVRVGGRLHTIVGVLPPEGRLHMPADAGMATDLHGWIAFDIAYTGQPRDGAYLKIVARLQPGVTTERAAAEVSSLGARLRAEHPEHRASGFSLRVAPLHDEVVAHIRPVLTVLGLSAAILLLVACANVAGLLLVRFLGRRVEVAVRRALGAEQPRLIASLVLESGLICVAGTGLGLLLAAPAVRGVLALEPGIVPDARAVGVDASLLPWVLSVAVVATLLSGFAPAVLATVDRVGGLLRSHGADGRGHGRLARRALVVVQVAASFALLYGSATLLGSLARNAAADPGYDTEGVLTFRVTLPFGSYRGPATWTPFFEDLEARLAALPDVEAAGITSDLPTRMSESPEPWAPAEAAATETWGERNALYGVVTPGYFDATGIDLVTGRGFRRSDGTAGATVAVVDETLAAALVRDGGPVLGRLLEVTSHEFEGGYRVERTTAQVVGVVEDVPHGHPDARSPGTIYMPLAQYPLWSLSVVVRGHAGVLPGEAGVRSALAGLDASVPPADFRTFAEATAEVLATTRFLSALVATLALVVVALAVAGLYGLVSESVLQRRRELGVRLALGARARGVVGLVIAGGMAMAAGGVLPGAVLAPWVSSAIRDALGHGPAFDLPALLVAVATITAVAAGACWIPARRAGRIEPARALDRH